MKQCGSLSSATCLLVLLTFVPSAHADRYKCGDSAEMYAGMRGEWGGWCESKDGKTPATFVCKPKGSIITFKTKGNTNGMQWNKGRPLPHEVCKCTTLTDRNPHIWLYGATPNNFMNPSLKRKIGDGRRMRDIGICLHDFGLPPSVYKSLRCEVDGRLAATPADFSDLAWSKCVKNEAKWQKLFRASVTNKYDVLIDGNSIYPKDARHYGATKDQVRYANEDNVALLESMRLKNEKQQAEKLAKEKRLAEEQRLAEAEKERVQAEKKESMVKGQQCVKKKSVEKCLDLLVPPDQLEFNLVVSTGREVYEKANNELKKTQVRLRRKGSLSSLSIKVSEKKYSFSNWTGEVIDMGSTGDQKGWLYIRPLGIDDVSLGTYNNDLSDTGLGTLIKPGSYVFNQLTKLSIKKLFSAGSTVYFSGAFYIPGKLNTVLFGDFASIGDEKDFFEEKSMTEKGAMTDPEFLVTFSCVKKVADGLC